MSKILCLETSTKNCSVALTENGLTVDVLEEASEQYSHAEKLHPFIQEILQRNKWSFYDLSAVAVSEGPGSYTGLRIGVSAAKGLAYTLRIPLIAVSTLETLARSVQAGEGYIIPLLDARRMEVYTAVFDKDYNMIKRVWAEILHEKSFEEFLKKGPVVFTGDAVEKTQTIISHPKAVFTEKRYPSAKEMSSKAFEKFQHKDFVDVAYFEPFYLKDFIVTRKKKPL